MRFDQVKVNEVENRRTAAMAWGTDPDELTLGELFLSFCGIALILSVSAVGLSWAIPAIRGAL